MAIQNVQVITDDFGGKGEATPVLLSVDGQTFRIDLNKSNRAKFNRALAKYMVPEFAVPPRKRSAAPRSRNSEAARIREWARDNGHTVADRGRLPLSLVEQYRAAQV